MKTIRSSLRSLPTALAAAGTSLLLTLLPLRADFLENLQSFPVPIPVGDPAVAAQDAEEGPKGIAKADFDSDGKPDLAVSNLDGTITVLISQGGGRFALPRHVQTSTRELRSVLAADLNNDGKPDLAAASPEDGQLMVFFNLNGGNFAPKINLPAWTGVRCLAAGDFDGDGKMDIAAAGPGVGVRHFRGTGGGAFEIMGDLPRLSPASQDLTHPRPVYTMRTVRSIDNRRDDLLVTHADSPELWILSTVKPDRSTEPPVVTRPASWSSLPPVIINEVQVQNAATLRDADGSYQPWVELLNKSTAPVNMIGWKLKLSSAEWNFPSVTIQPGRFLIVFLSGKNRETGPELHASFVLKQSTDGVNLVSPAGVTVHSVNLEKHGVMDVSRGLAPNENDIQWFDVPSPGAENNAGLGASDFESFSGGIPAELTITPPNPTPDQSPTVRVTLPAKPTGSTSVRAVWFSATPGLTEDHYPLVWKSPGVYEMMLPPGKFSAGVPYRLLVRLRDDGTENDYTVEVLNSRSSAAAGPAGTRPGGLVPIASVPAPKVKSFETGVLGAPAAQPGVLPDLVYADDTNGEIYVHPASADARRFNPSWSRELRVGEASPGISGLPRDVKLADMDADGWLDALVVLQDSHAVVICKNLAGTLMPPTGSLTTGASPREAVIADFTGDGRPDAAVINRFSADVSILSSGASGSGLVGLDQFYQADGDVAAMVVQDFTDDERDDVLQLHRASSEVSIRTAAVDGRLGAPVFFPVGAQGASALAVTDVNNDGRPDVITANLGIAHDGSISVLLGTTGGGFEAPRVFPAGASLFALAVADFNNDGNQDVVAGLWDCRVSFYFGNGHGSFNAAYELPVPFVNESRTMVTKDFNHDGKIDIAGAGIEGNLVTLKNTGAATGESWVRTLYPAPSQRVYGANRISAARLNDDDYPDLIVGTGAGVLLFQGSANMEFTPVSRDAQGNPLPASSLQISDVFMADIDADNKLDMVAACVGAACVNILTQKPDGSFETKLQVDVPAARFIATGDLDHDGKPDLVGTGDALWTVLSSHPPQIVVPAAQPAVRPQISGVVINEILGRNRGVTVATDAGRKPDYIELFNGTAATVGLTGWKLRVQGLQEGVPFDSTWTIPSGGVAPQGRTVLIFSQSPAVPAEGVFYSGFSLPAEGGTLTLTRADNTLVDHVEYPYAQENVAWSRYLDGHPSFHADRIPSPGMANLDNGTVPPEVKLTAPSPATMIAGMPLKFTARGRDDAGIISLSLLWNRVDAPLSEPQRLVLYDDGMHDDALGVDGLFAGRLSPGLPAGAEVQFYLEAVDLNGETVLLPDNAQLSAPGEAPAAWSFSLTTPPALEISEVCTGNTTLLRDELGSHPDYVKVRNKGAASVDLSRILLAKSPLSDNSAVYAFPQGQRLAAGDEFTVFADGNTAQGTLHAPFTLDAGGDDLSLLAVTPSGARQWIHSLTVPATAADTKYLILPGTTLHAAVTADANLNNWSGTAWDGFGNGYAVVRFATIAGDNHSIEGDAPGLPVAWTTLETVPGDGSMHTVTRPITFMSELRAVPHRLAPMVRVDAAMPDYQAAAVYGTVSGATGVTLYYGLTDGGSITTAWGETGATYTASLSAERKFAWNVSALNTYTLYYYRLRADTPGGVVWSAPGTFFRTLSTAAGSVSSLTTTQLNPSNAAVSISVNPPGAVESVEILAGNVDTFGNVAAWPRRFTATPGAEAGTWAANLTGLSRETNYSARVLIKTAAAQTVSAQRLVFRTPGAVDNLRSNLFLSEIMYHPDFLSDDERAAGFFDEDDFEFIELYNASDESMDLSGLWFEGIDFDFPASGGPVIAPRGYAVIAANPHAFTMRYGADIPLAGWTLHPFRNGRLSNGGEAITLHAADGTVLSTLTYQDSPWQTDGIGYSLEYRGPTTSGSFETTAGYLASRLTGGSPGWAGLPQPDQTFATWQRHYFSGIQVNDAAISGPNADPDKDGLSNLAEFAAGTRPLTANDGNPLSIRDGGVIDGWHTLLLTFPVNVAAKDAIFDLQGMDRTATGWQLDAQDAAGPIGGAGMSYFNMQTIQTSSNYLLSARLSADGKQILVTRGVVPYPPPNWWNPPQNFVPPQARLFRLMIRMIP